MLRIRIDKTTNSGQEIKARNCNLKCVWCHGDYFSNHTDKSYAISNKQIIECVTKVIKVTKKDKAKVRISGNGEPTLVDKFELLELISLLKKIDEVKKVSLTTNGTLLDKFAYDFKEVGLDSITISLNSLNKNNYELITGRNLLDRVHRSITICKELGINLKINAVYSKKNKYDIDEYLNLSSRMKIPIKFFDLLPQNNFAKQLYLPLSDLENSLRNQDYKSEKKNDDYVYKRLTFEDGAIFILKISSENNCKNLNCPFRDVCNEGCRSSIRIMSTGTLKPCGIKTDNTIDLLNDSIRSEEIERCLISGGKV